MPVETPKCYDEKGLSLAAISILTVSGYLPAKAHALVPAETPPKLPISQSLLHMAQLAPAVVLHIETSSNLLGFGET